MPLIDDPLKSGDIVAISNPNNPKRAGIIVMASDIDPNNGQQSIAIAFADFTLFWLPDGAAAVAKHWALVIDYKLETATDLFSTQWDMDIADITPEKPQ